MLRKALHLDSISLSTQLICLLLFLLSVGLSAAGVATRQMVWGYMLERTDQQLERQASLVISSVSQLSSSDPANHALTEYFLQIRDGSNKIISTPLSPSTHDGAVIWPSLPASGSSASFGFGQPVTVPARLIKRGSGTLSVQDAASWRVIKLKWVDTESDTSGIAYLGLSLADALDTSSAISRYFILVVFAILIIAMGLGTAVISRTLQPLKKIEKTAAAIAAGDLSQRVPSAPVSTEIGSLSASLNTMLSRIEESFQEEERTNAKMKQFVSDASHELRTPLAVIHGNAELYHMHAGLPVEERIEVAEKSLDNIERSASRMTLLVEDLLSLARMDEGRGVDRNQQVRLDELLLDSAEDLHALDPSRHIRVGELTYKMGGRMLPAQTGNKQASGKKKKQAPVYIPTAEPQFSEGKLSELALRGDSQRLRQVITNIVGNIHRYTPSDSPVEIALGHVSAQIEPQVVKKLQPQASTTQQMEYAIAMATNPQADPASIHPYAVIRISDHGPGVSEDSLSKLYERFYTADASRARERGGTGLGMAIALSVVKAHSGAIVASTTDGGGLTHTIYLPTQEMSSSGNLNTHEA